MLMVDRRGFELIQGNPEAGKFVCTWCGQPQPTRADLELHWDRDTRCRANRNVSNPLQTKYGMADDIPIIPGEANLNRVRGPYCNHPDELRKDLKNAEGDVIGYQCMHCYAMVPERVERSSE